MNRKRSFAMIIFSGTLWMSVGVLLLSLGLSLLNNIIALPAGNYPLASLLSSYAISTEVCAILLIALGLLIGYFKATRVLHKIVKRNVDIINSLPTGASFTKVFGLRYWLLIALMMALGMGIRFFGVPDDIRGLIDVAVGAALINGSMAYYRSALAVKFTM